MPPAGYLVNLPGGLRGETGMFYDYILARNGLFIQAESPLIKATFQVASAEIRGLAPLLKRAEWSRARCRGYLESWHWIL